MRCARRPVRTAGLITASVFAILLAGCASDSDEAGDAGGATGELPPSGGSAGRLLDETSADGHQLREVPADEAPSVALEVTEDPDAGWNVRLVTERFTFAPERVGAQAQPGEGHAHLYLDGDKIARLYGSWFHLPADALAAGEHTLMVQLNANDHTAWAVDGVVVSDSTELTGTGAQDGGHEHENQPGTPTNPPATGEPGADVSVAVQVSGGEVDPAPGRTSITVGQTVRIEVTSDQPDVVHVHGYDVEADVSSSAPAVLEFTADQSGLFEVETHESGLLLTQLVVE